MRKENKGYHFLLATLLCCLFCPGTLRSQCIYSASTPIPDNGTVTIQFSVSGLIDNNLSSPTQGICGIEIEFNHEYLGDVTMTLISPSGTSVLLIGPPTTAIGPTNLANWDIDFVPCGVPAAPDAGFADVWSNLQAWQTIFPYSGTYHPNTGCLENFNIGPANGIWQLVVQDHDQFQLGTIDSITLIFCNPTGLVCTECNPNAGLLSPSSFNICSGENIQSSDITVDFGGNIPSPATYLYEYLLVSGNTILQNGVSFSLTPPTGSYTICGISYLQADTSTINTLIDDGDYDLLSQAIDNGLVCAQLTNDCIEVEVSAQPDTMMITSDLCNGEVFSFGGENYTMDGVYFQTHDGPGLCDTVFEIRIFARTLAVTIDPTDTLTCGNGTVDIHSMVSGSVGPFIYQWTTVNGNILTPVNGQSIVVDQAGQYFVEISDGVCEGTGSVQVQANQGYPQVFFEGGTLSCINTVVDIHPIFIPADGIIQWTGPSGFMSALPDISVTVPGMYELSVTNLSGCTTTRAIDIPADTATYPIDIYILSKNCLDSTAILADISPQYLMGWNWTGPNMFSSMSWRPTVSEPGLYTLTGTFHNGCTRSGSYFFDGDYALPDLTVSPSDTINCNEIITLSLTSNTPSVNFVWNGPQGFYSTLPIIMVAQPGNYYNSVTATNGCSNFGSVEVALGPDIFNFQVITDTITCAQTQVSIGVVAPDADVYDWLNYSGPGDDENLIQVTAGGNYQVMMTDTNTGCIVIAEVYVPTNFAYTHFGYTTDTITCTHLVAELNFVPVPGISYASVHWELPDLTIVPGPTLMSNLPGEHRLVGTGTNGCIGVWRIHIPFDTLAPFVILETDTLQCSDTVMIISQSLDSITAYQWSGPGIVSEEVHQINVDEPGWYHLSAFGANGCPSEHDIFVDSNFVLPAYTLTLDSLRCDIPADLVVTPSVPVSSYAWFNSGGLLLSSDSILMVNLPGSYRLEVQGVNQCIAYDTISMEPVQYPVITVESDTLTCAAMSVPMTVQIDIPQYTLAWMDINNDTISLAGSILVSDAGPFIASVSGPNACETRDTIVVPFDTIPPIAMISITGQIKCKDREAMLDGIASTPDPLLYTWTTIGGNILSNPALVQVDVRDTGYYYLAVERLGNGCVDSAVFILQENPGAIVLVYLDIAPPQCSGDDNASVSITGLEGGVGPFQYQLDGGVFQSSPIFDELAAGTYLLTVADAENCALDTSVVIEPTLDFIVDAGPDLDIYLGESAQLTGATNLPAIHFLTDTWSSLDNVLCTDCAMFEVSPLETSVYTYQATSMTGCVKEDEMIVYVQEKGKYYLANVFSPNGDGINDEIRINPSPGIQRVVRWVVFDRWGNAVFGQMDFDPADASVSWNGQTSTGDVVNPGVFPYVLEIQLINGKHELFHGDITVIR